MRKKESLYPRYFPEIVAIPFFVLLRATKEPDIPFLVVLFVCFCFLILIETISMARVKRREPRPEVGMFPNTANLVLILVS